VRETEGFRQELKNEFTGKIRLFLKFRPKGPRQVRVATSLPGYPGKGVTFWIALNFADFRTLEKTSTHLSLPLNFADFRTLGETYICLV
jgi:hypothetical protein